MLWCMLCMQYACQILEAHRPYRALVTVIFCVSVCLHWWRLSGG